MARLDRFARIVRDRLRSRYGMGCGEASAWAAMTETQREAARMAEAAALVLAQELEAYAPAQELIRAALRTEGR